jgi:hypothetical protein
VHKNPWFTLVLGAMVGLVLGYVLAERQQVPPAKAAVRQQAAAAGQQGLPEGHPPVDATTNATGGGAQGLAAQAAELEGLLARTPNEPRLMVGLGNLYFDAGRWTEARLWYERAMEIESGPNVARHAVVTQPPAAGAQLALSTRRSDLTRPLAAVTTRWWCSTDPPPRRGGIALARLKEIKAANPGADLSAIESSHGL